MSEDPASSGRPILTLVSDRRRLGDRSFASLARSAVLGGVDHVQVREKDLPDRELRELVAAVLAALRGTGARVLVNGRPDVAEATGAHGVQLPEEGLPVADVKSAFPRLLVGASCHGLDAALGAEAAGADFVLLGPIFATPGKEDRALGEAVLAEVVDRVGIPVHAIGGIDRVTAARALEAGARGLAAIRAFLEGPPDAAARALRGS
jgi:thiamine-phosphate pyrophosphorylase